jgi:hypothetical protein
MKNRTLKSASMIKLLSEIALLAASFRLENPKCDKVTYQDLAPFVLKFRSLLG